MAQLDRDPTQTTTLRRRFAADLYNRFRALKGDIRKSIVARDALDLTGTANVAARPGQFDFPTDGRKVEEFMAWLERQVNAGILEVERRRGTRAVGQRPEWTDLYIREAYRKGVRDARQRVRQSGAPVPDAPINAVLRGPIHADAVGLLFTRTFTELQGITDAMAQQIGRELAEGLALGESPPEIARRLNQRVDVAISRARTMARTEVVRAYTVSSLNSYESLGIQAVTARVEFATAGDDRVCPTCASLEGNVYTIAAARGIIPVHPNCRCAFLPAEIGEARFERGLRSIGGELRSVA